MAMDVCVTIRFYTWGPGTTGNVNQREVKEPGKTLKCSTLKLQALYDPVS